MQTPTKILNIGADVAKDVRYLPSTAGRSACRRTYRAGIGQPLTKGDTQHAARKYRGIAFSKQ